MNWYLKKIFSQSTGLLSYLGTLGATPDIIQYIMSQGDNSQILVNEFRKNPSITIEQLQEMQQPEKVQPYTEYELKLSVRYTEPFKKWMLVNLRKIRISKEWSPEDQKPLIHSFYMNFAEELPNIFDWATRSQPLPDISSYDASAAIDASDEWHKMVAGKGKGKGYESTKQELIVYGPQWKNPEWQGWTIQKVMSENDLLAEGNKMDHCVGEFCDNVKEGFSVIYSLRDLQNNPHITLETDDYGEIKQIQGKSNSDPKDIYKSMIKEWISTNGEKSGIKTEVNAFENLEEKHPYDGPSVAEIREVIENIIQGEENEYGLKYVFDSNITDVINEMVTTGEGEASGYYSRNNGYTGDITDSSPYITNLALMLDLKLSHWHRHSGEWEELKKMPKQSDWKNIQEVEKWAWETIDEIQEDFMGQETGIDYPHEEDYENPEEYEEAMEQFGDDEAEVYDEWMGQSVKGGFTKDILDELKSFRELGLIPSAQELYKIEQEEQRVLNEEAEKRQFSEIQTSSTNWYKKAQQLEVIDSKDLKGKERSYTGTGHDIYYEEQNKLLGHDPNEIYSTDNPNIMWIYNKGQIEIKPETEMAQTHRAKENWGT